MPQKVLLTFVCLFFVWILIAGISAEEIVLGAIVSGLVAFVGSRELIRGSVKTKLDPRKWLWTLVYLLVFSVEEFYSHLDVIYRILSGKINPGLVEVKTKLKKPTALTVLGNSITLTPGTLTLDIKKNKLITYCLNKKSERIEKRFDWILEKVFR